MVKLDRQALEKAIHEQRTLEGLVFLCIAGTAVATGFLQPLALFILPFLFPLLVIAQAGVYYVLCRLVRGKGSYRSILSAFGMNSILFWPLALPLLNVMLIIPVIIWTTVLSVHVLTKTMNVSSGKALIIILLPWLLVLAALLTIPGEILAGWANMLLKG